MTAACRAREWQGGDILFCISGCLTSSHASVPARLADQGRAFHDTKTHVVYSGDEDVVEGLKASIASCIYAADTPSDLVIHVMVQGKLIKGIQKALQMDANKRKTSSGAVIELHEIPAHLVQHDRGEMQAQIRRERGQLDDPEVYARVYMDQIVPHVGVAIWLDADTIVRKDLRELQQRLLGSGKTIGFVNRATKMYPDFLTGKCMPLMGVSWQRLKNLTAYNTGVFAVNLRRWADAKATSRFEELVRLQNDCPGGLWKGGSQPPLTLTFQLHRHGEEDDFILFEEEWNSLGLGMRSISSVVGKNVLHWNGLGKPWKRNGLNKAIWQDYRHRYDDL